MLDDQFKVAQEVPSGSGGDPHPKCLGCDPRQKCSEIVARAAEKGEQHGILAEHIARLADRLNCVVQALADSQSLQQLAHEVSRNAKLEHPLWVARCTHPLPSERI